MTSFLCLTTFTPIITKTLQNSTSNCRSKSFPKQTHRFKISCNADPDDDDKRLILPETQKHILPMTSLDTVNVDRRNLLLGLGGIYSTSLPAAFAVPITAPDISTCVPSSSGFDLENTVRTKACCPPATSKPIKKFEFPNDRATRIRPAAHTVSKEYIAKYKSAIKAMRDLPDDHPHSFVSQAKIHCAYCNGGYTQVASGFPKIELQIHNAWLFFPFHRWYLYFYERILGKLINDPTFALPYWNWDNPAGMTLPDFFEEDGKVNPAFDAYRNCNHRPPATIDLNYAGNDILGLSCGQQISTNMIVMYRQMVTNAGDPLSFFGGKYSAGDDAIANGDPSVGSIEAGCHTAVHRWMGNPRMPNSEDMGNFYSAGYDPVFYVLHTNIDRMWKLWKEMDIKGHTEPREPDWLNASYVFYNENEELVRVYNKDCVRLEKLKYDYEVVPIPWKYSRPVARTKKSNIALLSVETVKEAQDSKFPLKLDKIRKVLVKRPIINRSLEDKENANEVLLIKEIMFNSHKFVKFDVFVNAQYDVSESFGDESEFAGSFGQLPHNHNPNEDMLMRSAIRFGLTELLEDIGATNDEFILVTLVPKVGCEEVTIGEIKVQLVPITD